MQIVRSCDHYIDYWVVNVCDKQSFDRAEPLSERKWQAPRFFVDPSGDYDAATAWERADFETSRKWRDFYCRAYWVRLETKVKKIIGEITVELAMQPTPSESAVTSQLGEAIRTLPSNVPEVGDEPAASSAAVVESLRKRIAKDENGTLRTIEAALLLGVSTKTINRRIQDGVLVAGAKRGTVTNASVRASLPKSINSK